MTVELINVGRSKHCGIYYNVSNMEEVEIICRRFLMSGDVEILQVSDELCDMFDVVVGGFRVVGSVKISL